mgnify:CR=1 FL=1
MKLCSDVDPMPFTEVEEVLREAFGCPWQEEFQEIQEKPLGSASIAQVHRAVHENRRRSCDKGSAKGHLRDHGPGYRPDEKGGEAPSPL